MAASSLLSSSSTNNAAAGIITPPLIINVKKKSHPNHKYTTIFTHPERKLSSSSLTRRRWYAPAAAAENVPTPIPMSTTTITTVEKSGIKVVTNPPESTLSGLGVPTWPKWGCPPSKFPWTYSSREICYLLKGKVKVYPDGSDEPVEIGAGDLVEFPKGMSCTWDVSEAVDKHYKFD